MLDVLFFAYKMWVSICTAVGIFIGFSTPFWLAAWILWELMNAR